MVEKRKFLYYRLVGIVVFVSFIASCLLTSSGLGIVEGFSAAALAGIRRTTATVTARSMTDTMEGEGTAFGVNVMFHVQPEHRAELMTVLSHHVTQSLLAEETSLQCQLGVDVDDPNILYLHEEFQSRSDHRDAHCQSEHYHATMAFLTTKKPVVRSVTDEYVLCHAGPQHKVSNRAGICLNVELNIPPDCRDEFFTVIAQNKHGSDTNEDGCDQYTWGESVTNPNTFHFHEQYRNAAALAAHTTSPHFHVWEQFAHHTPFTKPVRREFGWIVLLCLLLFLFFVFEYVACRRSKLARGNTVRHEHTTDTT